PLMFWALLPIDMTKRLAGKAAADGLPAMAVEKPAAQEDEVGQTVMVSGASMKSHEIFQAMSPALAAEIFTFIQTEQKPVYKAAIQGLANQRNLRGVFVER